MNKYLIKFGGILASFGLLVTALNVTASGILLIPECIEVDDSNFGTRGLSCGDTE